MIAIKFTKQSYVSDILNSEGPLLSIVEGNEKGEERLYLKAKIGFGKSIYCKVNETALNFFFCGRISVKELFLLRNDELFIIEKKDEKGSLNQKFYGFTEEFENEILNQLPFYNLNFFAIPESARIVLPYENIIKKLNIYYINSFGAISGQRLYQSGDESL